MIRRMYYKYKIYQISKEITKMMKQMRSYYPSIEVRKTPTDYWNSGREEGLWQALCIIKEVMNGK